MKRLVYLCVRAHALRVWFRKQLVDAPLMFFEKISSSQLSFLKLCSRICFCASSAKTRMEAVVQ
jgi:hypothetical protein